MWHPQSCNMPNVYWRHSDLPRYILLVCTILHAMQIHVVLHVQCGSMSIKVGHLIHIAIIVELRIHSEHREYKHSIMTFIIIQLVFHEELRLNKITYVNNMNRDFSCVHCSCVLHNENISI